MKFMPGSPAAEEEEERSTEVKEIAPADVGLRSG